MEKELLLERLKRITGNDNLKFPSQIQLSFKEFTLTMHINGKGVRDNMQTNGSAFEGWAICIKAYIPEIKNIILSWDNPNYSDDEKEKNRQTKHYNRFLMRVYSFAKFFDWFSISKNNKQLVNEFKQNHSNLFINYPKTESKEKISENCQIKKREAELERLIVTKLRKSIPLTDHQLPVGLFDNEVKTTKTCTPRGASQIDLWQLDKDTLRIFELKDKDNNSVGIISELIYYANIMNELIKGNIQYPQSIKTAKDIRNIKSLYSAIQNKSINTVEAIFLNYEFHPLIKYKKNQIMELINEGTRPHGIIFKDELVEKYL